ncbi:hypothetical protein CLF_106742 [Clonorchis sinensis]|uniref:Uncharacterized protein n=1 Tax=Clonorchis sinensis TaxID=79923 RepID=G7YFM4_CLOSI|nr:hypothetical protein CLF_106742 [Clonorchis sinensis]
MEEKLDRNLENYPIGTSKQYNLATRPKRLPPVMEMARVCTFGLLDKISPDSSRRNPTGSEFYHTCYWCTITPHWRELRAWNLFGPTDRRLLYISFSSYRFYHLLPTKYAVGRWEGFTLGSYEVRSNRVKVLKHKFVLLFSSPRFFQDFVIKNSPVDRSSYVNRFVSGLNLQGNGQHNQ